jgi:hypothetical protein
MVWLHSGSRECRFHLMVHVSPATVISILLLLNLASKRRRFNSLWSDGLDVLTGQEKVEEAELNRADKAKRTSSFYSTICEIWEVSFSLVQIQIRIISKDHQMSRNHAERCQEHRGQYEPFVANFLTEQFVMPNWETSEIFVNAMKCFWVISKDSNESENILRLLKILYGFWKDWKWYWNRTIETSDGWVDLKKLPDGRVIRRAPFVSLR